MRPKNPRMVEPIWLNHAGDPSPSAQDDMNTLSLQLDIPQNLL